MNRDKDVFKDHASAWKEDVERPAYEEIKQLAHEGKIDSVTVWALDRWVRRKDTLVQDVSFLTQRGVKLHSVRESYLENINIDGPLGETIRSFLLQLAGSIAEIESTRRSERIKAGMATSNKKPGVERFQFNKWRAYQLLFVEGLSLRKAAGEVGVSAATMHRFKKYAEENQDLFIKGRGVAGASEGETDGL